MVCFIFYSEMFACELVENYIIPIGCIYVIFDYSLLLKK